MQRRLCEESTTYSGVVENVRMETATRLPRDTRASLSEIAADLGYSTQGNFTRSFRRWAGVTPTEFRRG